MTDPTIDVVVETLHGSEIPLSLTVTHHLKGVSVSLEGVGQFGLTSETAITCVGIHHHWRRWRMADSTNWRVIDTNHD